MKVKVYMDGKHVYTPSVEAFETGQQFQRNVEVMGKLEGAKKIEFKLVRTCNICNKVETDMVICPACRKQGGLK